MDELKIIENLKKDIKLKIGRSLDAPADFDFLSMQIKMELHEYISPTTLKRFFNYITSDVKPRVSTMSLFARFVGAAGWQDYCNEFIAIEEGGVEKSEFSATYEEVTSNCLYSEIKKFHTSESGCCDIYKAKRFGRWHALKALKPEFKDDASCNERLYNEFSNVYLRTHPNLVRSVGYEQIGELGNCIVMEYVEGEGIIDYIKNNSLDSDHVLPLIKELAVIIDFLHENGIVHNDIRRENVFVTYDGGHVKLVDFAKSTGNFYIKYKEYPDLGAFVELVKEINGCIRGGLPNLKRFLKRFDEGKRAQEMVSAAELAEILSEKRNWMPALFAFAIIFSALVSSVFTSSVVNGGRYGSHVYIDSLQVDGRYVRDFSSTIVIYDTISKIVIEKANAECRKLYKNVDTISIRKDKFIAFTRYYRQLKKEKDSLPILVLDKYLPKESPEYNLYKSSLVQLTEDIYTQYYNFKVDSLRNTK